MNTLMDRIEFGRILKKYSIDSKRNHISTLQVNIGKKCNQACVHCHVNAGPARTEEMSIYTIDRILHLLGSSDNITTVDITGGAPELNRHFRYFISELKKLDVTIIDRCNLSVLFEKGQEKTAEFLAGNSVVISASLPCYTEKNVNLQRGPNAYEKSISALKLLNELGYGREGSNLIINLVYNPMGAYLPPDQKSLELEYKKFLKTHHGIVFNNLYTIVNMPINRFADALIRDNEYDSYCSLLYNSFNPETAGSVMCKNQLSIGWNGKIYDCDFNQALNIPVSSGGKTIWDINKFDDVSKEISFANHCYGCTACNGSSCGGEIARGKNRLKYCLPRQKAAERST